MKTISLVLKRVRKGVRTDVNTGAVQVGPIKNLESNPCISVTFGGTSPKGLVLKLK